VTLASETKNNTLTVYAMVLYMSFDVNDGVLEEVSGGHTPSVLTFDISSEDEYRLTDYWEPRDGSYYVEDIREKFPEIIQDMALDTQSAILPQTRECYAQAVAQANVDPTIRIEQLLDILTATPENSEDVEEHISAHALEYRELSYYGQYTQQYISEHSEESGLKGEILRKLEEEF
jgi:hypothetical protein